jgi:hypothetical protein
MAPSVDLTPVAFTRLRRAPCRWSIQSRVSSPRLLDAYETKDGTPVPATDDGEASNLRQFNPNKPPDLTHTKVLAIEFGGKPLARGDANWNGLLNAAVRLGNGPI